MRIPDSLYDGEVVLRITVITGVVLGMFLILLPRSEKSERQSPSRVPEGWETLDATPGFDRWAKRAKDPRSGIVFILVEPGQNFMMGSPRG